MSEIATNPIPKICGTCSGHDPESGYCLMWCMITDSAFTCDNWKLEEDEGKEPLPKIAKDKT